MAKDLIVYPKAKKSSELEAAVKSQGLSFTRVFSDTEKEFLGTDTQIADAIKVFGVKDDKAFSESITNLSLKIESTQKLEFYNEYEGLQWALHNSGSPLKVKLTDIDTIKIPALASEDIRIEQLEETDREILVAVVDSGIDLNHPDLASQVYKKESECEALKQYNACLESSEDKNICEEKFAKIDTDNNGYPMDCHGWNVAAPVNEITKIQGNQNTQDQIGHGTFVSGVIGALDNNIGVRGVIQNVKILPVKVSGSDEEVEEENATDIFAKGILYALKNKVDIINLSVGWASNEDSLLVTEMIERAHKMGILVVVAGGNSAHSNITYPCSYHEVICVGSHNPDGELSHFSNRGSTIDLLAPGRRILSTWPEALRPIDFVSRHGYEYKDGTSFSAPYVVGALAQLMNHGMNSEEAKVALLRGTRDKKAPLVLNGNLDIKNSLKIKRSSFIYPFKKTPALINWEKPEKKLVFRLKNYLEDAKNIKIQIQHEDPAIELLTSEFIFEKWNKDEIKDFELYFKAPAEYASDLVFQVSIASDSEKKSYPLQAIGLTVVHEKFKRDDTESFMLKSKVDLSKVSFKVFDNIDEYHSNEFLVIDSQRGKVRMALMKFIDNSYRISKFLPVPLDEALIAQAVRLDIDQDGTQDYVVIGLKRNEDQEWVSHWFVLNENFKPKEFEVVKDNVLDSKIAPITDKINWIKKDGRYIPIWIAKGYIPQKDLPAFDPWEPNFINTFMRRVYYLDGEEIRTKRLMQDDTEYATLSFLAQSPEQRKNSQLELIVHPEMVFKKTYYKVKLDHFNLENEYLLPRYHDVEFLDPLVSNDGDSLIYSEFVPSSGKTRLSIFSKDSMSVSQHTLFYENVFDTIQTVFSQNSDGSFFALTKYNLLFNDGHNNYLSESRNTDRLIQYKKVLGKNAIYLSGQFTPGFSSEYIEFDGSELIRKARFRLLPYGSCSEVGFHSQYWTKKNFVIFYCDQNKALHFINL